MLPPIQPQQEIQRITSFLQQTMKEQRHEHAIVAVSGGIDSSLALTLAVTALGPEHVLVLLLPYREHNPESLENAKHMISFLKLPPDNVEVINIGDSVDAAVATLGISEQDIIRRGNIMARMRMLMLYDRAKKHTALVVGTENRSEYFLGYFTRFGDEASDIEPIQHLYKTQVYQLATYLKIPEQIIEQAPTAGLWQGQTDEGQFGFSYQEADEVLYRYFDRHEDRERIQKDHPNAEKIIAWAEASSYKHHVPYIIEKHAT